MTEYNESALMEQPAIELFKSLDYIYSDRIHETLSTADILGRENSVNVGLTSKQRETVIKFNPSLPADAIDQAIGELIRDRSILNPDNANIEIYSHAGWINPLSKELNNE